MHEEKKYGSSRDGARDGLMPIYYTPDEVAAELRVTRRTVYEWLKLGRLHGFRAGRSWRIREEDVRVFLKPGVGQPEEHTRSLKL